LQNDFPAAFPHLNATGSRACVSRQFQGITPRLLLQLFSAALQLG
jgi:hypothetical protein